VEPFSNPLLSCRITFYYFGIWVKFWIQVISWTGWDLFDENICVVFVQFKCFIHLIQRIHLWKLQVKKDGASVETFSYLFLNCFGIFLQKRAFELGFSNAVGTTFKIEKIVTKYKLEWRLMTTRIWGFLFVQKHFYTFKEGRNRTVNHLNLVDKITCVKIFLSLKSHSKSW